MKEAWLIQCIGFITADVGGQLGLFCGASMITIIEIIEYIFTNFYWICILLLLKIPEMTPRAHPPQTHLGNKNNIEECWCSLKTKTFACFPPLYFHIYSWLTQCYVILYYSLGESIKPIVNIYLLIDILSLSVFISM